MSDEELLKKAEEALRYDAKDEHEENQMKQFSIAASLLVIARNSLGSTITEVSDVQTGDKTITKINHK